VGVRTVTWKSDENPQDRDALNKSAVVEAKVAAGAAAASEPTVRSEWKHSYNKVFAIRWCIDIWVV
jgi:hypothetical protein